MPSSNASSASMQTYLDKSLAKNEEYRAQVPTLQDRPTIIHVNLNRLQVKQTKLEVEYWKLEAN